MIEIFIPIKKENIAFYFSAGIIKPKKYLPSNAIPDIQDEFTGWVLGFKNKYLVESKSDCLISVLLNDDEFEWAGNEKNACYIRYIPISRIQTIIVKNLNNFRAVINNINQSTDILGGTAFIDENIFKEDDKVNERHLTLASKEIKAADNFAEFFDDFDRLMGAMALIRYKNSSAYNKSFFDELSVISNIVSKEFELKTNFKANTKEPRIKNNKKEDLKENNYQRKIEKEIKKPIDTLFNNKGQLKDKDYKLDFSSKNFIASSYKLFHALSLNGENIFNELEVMSADALFAYGYNQGYDKLRSYYGNGENRKNVKFNLNKYIDEIAIELIYQYLINKELEYLATIDLGFLDCKKTKNLAKKNKDKFYLFDATEPIEIIDFYEDIEFYKDNTKLLNRMKNDFIYLKQNEDLANSLKNNQELFQKQAEKVANYCVDKKIEKLMLEKIDELKKYFLDTAKEINDISENYRNISEKQKNFYTHIVDVPKLKYEIDDLKEENQKLKDEIKELKGRSEK